MNTAASEKAQTAYRRLQRTFGPVYDARSRILILGSFPSVQSRAVNFFYGHPQNRFWPLMAKLLDSPCPETKDEKTALMLRHRVALWDSIDSCDIIGSSDSSIKNVIPVDIMQVLDAADIRRIFANGATSAHVYQKYLQPVTGRDIVVLPSTSPANAAWDMARLCEAWRPITEYI